MCEFCKDLENERECVRIIADQHKDEEAEFGRWTIIDQSVAIIIKTTHIRADGSRVGTIATTTCYKDKGRGFDLNYCPECGKEIKHVHLYN